MIIHATDQSLFHLQTNNSSYLIRILPTGHLVNQHYGARLEHRCGLGSLYDPPVLGFGNTTAFSDQAPALSLDLECLETSPWGRGDYRRPSLLLQDAKGDRSCDFRYQGHRILDGLPQLDGLPSARVADPALAGTLEIDLLDAAQGLVLTLVYGVIPACDVIVRHVRLSNRGGGHFRLLDVASFILDLGEGDFNLTTLNGAWIREHQPHCAPLRPGIQEVSSIRGTSSNAHDPFLLLSAPAATETGGECYGFSLVYSGNHSCRVELNPHGLTRVHLGINPTGFSWDLPPGASFEAPQGVLCFSAEGRWGLSGCLHRFVREHLVRGEWQHRQRPVLVNSWEACYFNINERNLLGLARSAKKLGVELFVMDDGWFGRRDDDTSSLGDWRVNLRKLPGGLDRLARRINAIGLDFGIWVEPEMICVDSDLYRAHPDWLVRSPAHDPAPGRNQFYLDLTRREVRDHLVGAIGEVLGSANIAYVKWDMNRHMADWFSPGLPADRQGEFVHRYMLGLYEVLGRITSAFPKILFESCASGGNRFDYGMFCYMPQVWASDDSDAVERLAIQAGASLFAPPSVMGAHVSAVPNHQVLRHTPIESRFNAAAFGLLGYELDFRKLSNVERQIVARQIAWYKEWRQVLQFGDFHRLIDGATGRHVAWLAMAPDRRSGVLGWFQKLAAPNRLADRVRLTGLDAAALYRIANRPQFADIRQYGELVNQLIPVKLKINGVIHNLVADNYLNRLEDTAQEAGGDQLMHRGLLMKRQFHGTGMASNLAIIGDFGSRLFELKTGGPA